MIATQIGGKQPPRATTIEWRWRDERSFEWKRGARTRVLQTTLNVVEPRVYAAARAVERLRVVTRTSFATATRSPRRFDDATMR